VSSDNRILVGDVGGTHARFAVVVPSGTGPWRVRPPPMRNQHSLRRQISMREPTGRTCSLRFRARLTDSKRSKLLVHRYCGHDPRNPRNLARKRFGIGTRELGVNRA
jgi:hypothetical protein